MTFRPSFGKDMLAMPAYRDLEVIRDERDEVTGQMTAMAARSAESGRPMGDAGRGRYNALVARMNELNDELWDAAEARDLRARTVHAAMQDPANVISGDGAGAFNSDPLGDPRGSSRPRRSNPWAMEGPIPSISDGGELRSRALDAIAATSGATDAMRERASRMVEADEAGEVARWALVASDPAYLRAFGRMLRDPLQGHMEFDASEREAFSRAKTLVRAMSLTDASGGFLVPFQLDPSITLSNTGTLNPLRQIARKVTATSDVWNGVSSEGVTAEWLAEAAEAADAAPTLAQPAITTHKGSAWVPYSFEVGMDSARNLTEELGRLLSDARDRLEATAFTVGTGTGQPKGLITAVAAVAGSRVASATADTFVVGDLYAVRDALPARYFLNGRWMFHPKIDSKIRQFGTADSHALFSRIGEAAPPALLGRPYHFASDMDGVIDAAQDNDIVLFGDFSSYVIADRVGTIVELVPNLVGTNHRPTGQRGLFMWWRVGADVIDTDAFRILRA